MTDAAATAPTTSAPPRGWAAAFEAARAGEVDAARAICAEIARGPSPFAGANEILLGRCLAESGSRLDEAVDLLMRAREIAPENISAAHTLALALMRNARSPEAAVILKTEKLPHDPFLLAQMALTMETQIRDWPERLPEGWPAMPEELEKQGAMRGDDGKNEKNENNAKNGKNERTEIGELESCKAQGEPRSNTDIAIVPSPSSSDTQEPPSSPSSHTSHPPATPRKPKLTRAQRRLLQKLIPRMETDFLEHRCAEAVAGANELIGAGAEDPEMHLIAGLACEEGGDGPRARMHLVRLIEFEPAQMMARTFLARVYWRNGWNDLAEDLWRSLPIEGPDDYGRHYHLALAHEAAGRRADALRTMLAGLNDFYMETREFYIERAWWRWNRRVGEGGGGGGGGD